MVVGSLDYVWIVLSRKMSEWVWANRHAIRPWLYLGSVKPAMLHDSYVEETLNLPRARPRGELRSDLRYLRLRH